MLLSIIALNHYNTCWILLGVSQLIRLRHVKMCRIPHFLIKRIKVGLFSAHNSLKLMQAILQQDRLSSIKMSAHFYLLTILPWLKIPLTMTLCRVVSQICETNTDPKYSLDNNKIKINIIRSESQLPAATMIIIIKFLSAANLPVLGSETQHN